MIMINDNDGLKGKIRTNVTREILATAQSDVLVGGNKDNAAQTYLPPYTQLLLRSLILSTVTFTIAAVHL